MNNLKYKLVTNDTEMRGILAVRRNVFIEEQGISETIELNGDGPQALYMVVKDGRKVIGTARIRFLAGFQAKLERMAVLKPFRGAGIGKAIVSFLDNELKKTDVEMIVLHAQYATRWFYGSCGFEAKGLPFSEAGMKHIRMEKKL